MKRAKRIPKEIRPQQRIDLHGYTVDAAYQLTKNLLNQYFKEDVKAVEVITGRSGQIRKEFPLGMNIAGYNFREAIHGGSFIVYKN